MAADTAGLFCLTDVKKDGMVCEYTGEIIRSIIGDAREKRYAEEGLTGSEGGCYMFRLDKDYIVDATGKGNVARFTNHSCQPNTYVKVVRVVDHTASAGKGKQLKVRHRNSYPPPFLELVPAFLVPRTHLCNTYILPFLFFIYTLFLTLLL